MKLVKRYLLGIIILDVFTLFSIPSFYYLTNEESYRQWPYGEESHYSVPYFKF